MHSDRRRGGDWETGTPLRRAEEDEWEATPARSGGGAGGSMRRPDSSMRPGTSAWELASPAPSPVRAGSGKRAPPAHALLSATNARSGSVRFLTLRVQTCCLGQPGPLGA